jgi:hypothetical protein
MKPRLYMGVALGALMLVQGASAQVPPAAGVVPQPAPTSGNSAVASPAGGQSDAAASNTVDIAGIRAALLAKVAELEAQLKQSDTRRLELRESMREAFQKRTELPDTTAVDDETRELMNRVVKAEAELKAMRAELQKKLVNSPAYKQDKTDMDKLREELSALTLRDRAIQSERQQTLKKLQEIERQPGQ